MRSSTPRRSPYTLWLAVLALIVVLSACTAPPVSPTPGPEAKTPQPTESARSTPSATLAPSATPTLAPTATPTRDPNTSPLTGMRVEDRSLIERRVIAIRVGNDPEARPQEGLAMADLVYEEVMDGWSVTRFTALYLESDAERVRPLRSARLSSIEIGNQYDAAVVHTGASDGVRWRLSQVTFANLDQYFHPAPFRLLNGYDWRSRMYTTTELVRSYLEEENLDRGKRWEGFRFGATPPKGKEALAVHIPYPSTSIVDWEYDGATGRYRRSVAGRPHIEGLTGEQIVADNVVLLYAEHRATDIVEDINGATAIDIVLSGSGRVRVVRDGVVVEGTWAREHPDEPIQFYAPTGERIALRPGKTWIQLIPTDYEVEIQPTPTPRASATGTVTATATAER